MRSGEEDEHPDDHWLDHFPVVTTTDKYSCTWDLGEKKTTYRTLYSVCSALLLLRWFRMCVQLLPGDIRKRDLHKVAGVAGIFTLSVCNL